MLSRRHLLSGIAAAAIAPPSLAKPTSFLRNGHRAADPVWGIGPAMYAINEIVEHNGRLYRCVAAGQMLGKTFFPPE